VQRGSSLHLRGRVFFQVQFVAEIEKIRVLAVERAGFRIAGVFRSSDRTISRVQRDSILEISWCREARKLAQYCDDSLDVALESAFRRRGL
jgi:hypothetical protein